MNRNNQIILFAAACPVDMGLLKAKDEYINIFNEQQDFDASYLYRMKSFFKLSIGELTNHVITVNPNILHLSNHSLFGGDTVFEDKVTGHKNEVDSEYFGNFFRFTGKNLEMVFLNSCYSIEQAKEVSQHIKYVVAMSDHIPDEFAIKFATNFYKMLFIKKEYLPSFAFARNNVGMEDQAKVRGPQLYEDGNRLNKEEIEERLISSENSIEGLTLELKTILENNKSRDEKRLMLQDKSLFKDGLNIFWSRKKQLADDAAKKILSDKTRSHQISLMVDISNVLAYIHDAILIHEPSHLACYPFETFSSTQNVRDSLNLISNKIHCNSLILKKDRAIITEYLSLFIDQI